LPVVTPNQKNRTFLLKENFTLNFAAAEAALGLAQSDRVGPQSFRETVVFFNSITSVAILFASYDENCVKRGLNSTEFTFVEF
jgi:hypothetical protein